MSDAKQSLQSLMTFLDEKKDELPDGQYLQLSNDAKVVYDSMSVDSRDQKQVQDDAELAQELEEEGYMQPTDPYMAIAAAWNELKGQVYEAENIQNEAKNIPVDETKELKELLDGWMDRFNTFPNAQRNGQPCIALTCNDDGRAIFFYMSEDSVIERQKIAGAIAKALANFIRANVSYLRDQPPEHFRQAIAEELMERFQKGVSPFIDPKKWFARRMRKLEVRCIDGRATVYRGEQQIFNVNRPTYTITKILGKIREKHFRAYYNKSDKELDVFIKECVGKELNSSCMIL